MRRLGITLALFLATVSSIAAIHAQSGNAGPSFDVASIKPLPDGASVFPIIRATARGRVEGRGNLEALIRLAYGMSLYEKLVWPDRFSRSLARRFEVSARPPDDPTLWSYESVQLMTRRLLTERFQLDAREETEIRDVTVLRLAEANTMGPGLRLYDRVCRTPSAGASILDPRFDDEYRDSCVLTIREGHLRGTAETMSEFARLLSMIAQRPIIDGTGLVGRFQIEMAFAFETLAPVVRPRPPESRSALPSVREALRNNLGIVMDDERRPIRVVSVEYVGELVPN